MFPKKKKNSWLNKEIGAEKKNLFISIPPRTKYPFSFL